MRIIAIADLHIGDYPGPVLGGGINARYRDICDRISEVLAYAETNQVKHIFLLGDVFKDRFPASAHLRTLSEMMRFCADNQINLHILIGNHDRPKLSDQMHHLFAFDPLLPPLVRIWDKPGIIKVEGLRIGFMPYEQSPQQPLLEMMLSDHPNLDVLCLHGMISGCKSGLFEYEIKDDDVIPTELLKDIRVVLAGDVHDGQHFDNVYYPGSLERLTFNDEARQKGFWDITVDDKVDAKFVPVNARRMVTMTAEMIGSVDVKDAIIRIQEIDPHDVSKVRKTLMDAGCFYISSIKLRRVEETPLAKPTAIFSPTEMIRQYAQKVGYTGNVDTAIKTILDSLNA